MYVITVEIRYDISSICITIINLMHCFRSVYDVKYNLRNNKLWGITTKMYNVHFKNMTRELGVKVTLKGHWDQF